MTNGEMIQKVFNCEVCELINEDDVFLVIFADKKDSAIGFDWSWWNAEYKEPTTKDNLGVDAISRTQAQTEIEMNASRYTISKERCGIGQVEWSDQLIKVSDAVDIIRNLPSVTPQEPKTGHWIRITNGAMKEKYICSECGRQIEDDGIEGLLPIKYPYCHCGAKMVESQESEDVEAVKAQLPLCEDVIHGDFTGVIV